MFLIKNIRGFIPTLNGTTLDLKSNLNFKLFR
jgi:hypothetical protein